MSLINDALKRAKHAQPKRPPLTTPGPALRPAEPVRRNHSGPGILIALVLVALVGVGGLIFWFAAQSGSANKSLSARATKVAPVGERRMIVGPKSTTTPPKGEEKTDFPNQQNFSPNLTIKSSPPIATVSAPKLEPLPTAGMSAPIPAPATVPNQSVTPQTASVATPTQLVATVALTTVVSNEPPPPPPLPKLQGIFYRPDRPAALLNGKTVLVGSTSGEYRVVAISQQGVTVVRAGQTNVLAMPD